MPAEFTLEQLRPNELNDKPRRMLTGDLVWRRDNVLCFGLPGRADHSAADWPALFSQSF